MNKRASNAKYYAAHRNRLIFREEELRPSTILELIDCLRELDLHPADRRIERLSHLYFDLTGAEAARVNPSPTGDTPPTNDPD